MRPEECLHRSAYIVSKAGTLHVVADLTSKEVRVRPPIPNMGAVLIRSNVEQMLRRGALHIRTTEYNYDPA